MAWFPPGNRVSVAMAGLESMARAGIHLSLFDYLSVPLLQATKTPRHHP